MQQNNINMSQSWGDWMSGGGDWKKWIIMNVVRVLLSIPFLLSTYVHFKTKGMKHPTIYFASSSKNVKIMFAESKFYRNTTIVEDPVLADIVWDKRKYLAHDYYDFGAIQSHQAWNHIIGETVIAEKGKLTRILKEKKEELGCGDDCFSDTFYPLTFELVLEEDIQEFLRIYDNYQERKNAESEGEGDCEIIDPDFTWMIKPTSLSSGEGIKIFTNEELADVVEVLKSRDPENPFELIEKLNEYCEFEDVDAETVKLILQKYISKPLLVDGKKFSIRSYFLVASLSPYRVLLWNDARTATSTDAYEFTPQSLTEKTIHLTNVHQQTKKKVRTKDVKIWNLERLTKYLMINGIVEDMGWAEDDYLSQVKNITHHVLDTWYDHLAYDVRGKYHFFGLYGLDLLIDEDLNVLLTEVQKGCGMSIRNVQKRRVVQPLIHEIIEIIHEIQQWNLSNRRKEDLKELKSRKNFIWVINGALENQSEI